MKTLRVSDAVWKHLQQHGRPFEDSPNDVLERLFGLPSTTSSEQTDSTTTASGRTVQQSFRDPIIAALKHLDPEDFRAHKKDVLDHIGRTMPLTPADRAKNSKGEEAWTERAQWEAVAMRRDRQLLSRQRGIWELVSKFDEIPLAE